MAKLSDSERKDLESNPNVRKVTKSNVAFTPKFKLKAVRSYLNGSTPIEIFEKAGVNLSSFGKTYAKGCLKKWKKIFEDFGEAGFTEERRGNKKGRPKGRKFNSLEEENAYLRAELDFLKKLRALEALSLEKNKNSR